MENKEQTFVYHHDSVSRFIEYVEEVNERRCTSISNLGGSSESDFDFMDDEEAVQEIKKLAKKVYKQVKDSLTPTEALIQRLKELRIKRRKGAVETLDTGSARLTKDQLQHIYSDLVTSKFTLEEVAKIRRNWAKFSQRYAFDNPTIFFSLKKGGTGSLLGPKNMQRFKMFLSHGLPNRGLHNVYRKWVSLVCAGKKGKFSHAEECLIKELLWLCMFDSRMTRVNIIMLALQRSRKAVVTKIKEFQALPLPDVIPAGEQTWTVKREEELVKELCEELGAESLEQLKGPVSDQVWTVVAKNLGMTRKQAYKRWHHHLVPALMAVCSQTRPELEMQLVRRLKEMVDQGEVTDWRHVNWKRLAEEVGGYGHHYVYRVVMTMRWNNVKRKKDRDSIKESVQRLYEVSVCSIRDRSPRRSKSSNEMILRSPVRDGYLPTATYDFTSHTLCYE